ncbi:carboxyltransferase subunit alpha [Lactobacillaceae bacterium 24-114]
MNERLSPTEIVKLTRSDDKLTGREIINTIFPDFFELHGDRAGSDDPAIIGGLASFDRQPVTVISTDRGQTPAEKVAKRFGSAMPGGYRKALRLVEQAAKFQRPVFLFVNTAGAFPSKDAEEEGQGAAIAENILKIGQAPVPILTVIYGEGGSGGALALACGDEVWMLNYSTYSILSPEGFASIMWKDSSRADEAAKVMQMIPEPLLKNKIIEGIISESNDHAETCANIQRLLEKRLNFLNQFTGEQLLARRRERYRKF